MHPVRAVQNYKLFIDGEWQGALDCRTFEKANPFTGELISRFSSAGAKDASRAIERIQALVGDALAKAP